MIQVYLKVQCASDAKRRVLHLSLDKPIVFLVEEYGVAEYQDLIVVIRK
jgi:hypothetical protein